MPCLIGCLALLFPPAVIICMVIFSDYIGSAYQTVIWPLLGFFFLPLTTLAYDYAINSTGSVSGFHLVLVVLAVLVDLGIIGGNASNQRVRTYAVKRACVVEGFRSGPLRFGSSTLGTDRRLTESLFDITLVVHSQDQIGPRSQSSPFG
jgi:hypothetical protein